MICIGDFYGELQTGKNYLWLSQPINWLGAKLGPDQLTDHLHTEKTIITIVW